MFKELMICVLKELEEGMMSVCHQIQTINNEKEIIKKIIYTIFKILISTLSS